VSAPGGFERVAIIGVGLVGGSMAASLKRRANAPFVVGIDTDEVALRYAVEHGALDEGARAGSGAAARWLGPDGVDLVVIATPARYAASWLEQLGRGGYTGAITDVASTKAGILAAARNTLAVIPWPAASAAASPQLERTSSMGPTGC
jgi:prephenate dehydrogenase